MSRFGFGASDKEQDAGKKEDEKNKRLANRRAWARDRKVRRESFDRGLGIGGLVIGLLIFASMLSVLNGDGNPPTFMSFLEFLRTCPSLELDFLMIDFNANTAVGEIIIGLPIKLHNAFIFIGECMLNAITIFVWFLRWLLL